MNRTTIIIIAAAALMLLVVYLTNRPAIEYQVPFYQYNSNTSRVEKYYQPFDGLQQIDFFAATDQNGKEYTSDSLEGKIYVVDYFFVTCPGICKKMSAQMQRLYTLYEEDTSIVLVSFTSKPEEDSIPVLNAYAKSMGIKKAAKWKLLHADRNVAYSLAKDEFAILNEQDEADLFVHTERFALVDKNGHIRGYYDGTSPKDIDRMVKDIGLIKKEKNS
ncbi:MAG TPA: SCO family protein [Cytophagales bacterium]|nr:SCO family protein [Cytophagales bacterium]